MFKSVAILVVVLNLSMSDADNRPGTQGPAVHPVEPLDDDRRQPPYNSAGASSFNFGNGSNRNNYVSLTGHEFVGTSHQQGHEQPKASQTNYARTGAGYSSTAGIARKIGNGQDNRNIVTIEVNNNEDARRNNAGASIESRNAASATDRNNVAYSQSNGNRATQGSNNHELPPTNYPTSNVRYNNAAGIASVSLQNNPSRSNVGVTLDSRTSAGDVERFNIGYGQGNVNKVSINGPSYTNRPRPTQAYQPTTPQPTQRSVEILLRELSVQLQDVTNKLIELIRNM